MIKIKVYTAENGYLECLKYLDEINNNKMWGDIAIKAAKNGQLKCLKFLHEKRYKINNETLGEAARNGRIECLIFLHKNGYTFESDNERHFNLTYWNLISMDTIENNYIECLIYICENVFQLLNYNHFYEYAIELNRTDCIIYLEKFIK